jgi:cell division protein FtsL
MAALAQKKIMIITIAAALVSVLAFAILYMNQLSALDTSGEIVQENQTNLLVQNVEQNETSSSSSSSSQKLAKIQNNSDDNNNDNVGEDDQSSQESRSFNKPKVVGNLADIDLKSGMNTISLQSPNEKVSIRFTAKYSGDASTITIAVPSPSSEDIRIGLQEDNEGLPSGEWIMLAMNHDVSSFLEVQKEGNRFLTVSLEQNLLLTEGEIYHIVIENASDAEATTTSNKAPFSVMTYRANALAQPFNDKDPDVLWPDNSTTVLSYDGDKWMDQKVWPIFVIGYSDGRSEGQPSS